MILHDALFGVTYEFFSIFHHGSFVESLHIITVHYHLHVYPPHPATFTDNAA